jgi:hypothetical protein
VKAASAAVSAAAARSGGIGWNAAICLASAGVRAQVEAGLFARNPDGAGRYAGRLVCRALCQGAALHYVDGINGIKDFDVWSFYAQRDDGPFPARWRGKADFGPSKFGRDPGAPPSYAGRRVDCLGRSLPVLPGADPIAVIRGYLSSAHTASAKALAIKAAVLIDPEDHAGMVVWPELASDEVGDNQVKISNLSGDLFRHDAPDNDSILTLTSISERYALLSAPSQRIPNLAEVERSPGTGTRSHAADRVRANGRPCRIGCSRSRLRVPEVTCPSSGALPRDPGDGCLDLRKPPTVETNQRIRLRE